MKKWLISFVVSTFISCLGLVYFVSLMAQDRCLDSGGRWLGVMRGCDGGNDYSLQFLTSPLAIAIFSGIILGISSALVQIHTLLCKYKGHLSL